MNIIIPMAGMGKRMRPHTLTVPKPLFPIAGQPIVKRLVADIAKVCHEPIENIGFIISRDFGTVVEDQLQEIASQVGSIGHIYYQEEALGTAHAILCAEAILTGNTIVAFADTLFKADFKLDASQAGIIWVQQVKDPAAFGVVKLNEHNEIMTFVEKPTTYVSDLAIIGIYYFKDGDYLKRELKYLLDNHITDKGEFQLTNALENMKKKGTKFVPVKVTEWLDCGNKTATVHTNQRYLEFIKDQPLVAPSATIENSVIIAPCYIGADAVVTNAVVGPHVSIGAHSKIKDSVLKNMIVQTNTAISNQNLANSIVGNFVTLKSQPQEVNIGDYNTVN